MSENMFEKSLAQYQEFQNKWAESAAEIAEQFDPAKFMEQLNKTQDNFMKGMKVLIDLKPEDIESDQLEKDVVFTIGKMKLLHYKPTVSARRQVKVPLMITYALVNRQYMMDLQPDRSTIKSFLDAGLDVYMIDWGYPTAEDMYLTLDDVINWYMDDCVDFIRKETKQDKINLLGVCQGGTFSTMYTAIHQEKVKNLVTLVVPIDFSVDDAMLFRWSHFMNIDSLVDAYDGVVPGDVMNIAYLILKPLTLTLDKYVGMTDKWADKDHLVPLSASEPFMDALGSTDKTFLHFPTGHIGMFTSSKSKTEIVPTIITWLKDRSK